ncbi:MAG: hypothetical protein AAF721_10235 [Myxococcota bacterium]
MGRFVPTVALMAILGCGGDPPPAEGTSGSLSLTHTGGNDDGASEGEPTAGEADETADGGNDVDGGPMNIKFDVGPPDAAPPGDEEEGCTKVDFLFVIDNSNSMATNQGELVASFPEFVAGIEGTLTNVDSFHVGVVTSDAYAFNGPGCTETGAVVTQTGGVNSSNAVCDPFVAGDRYMTELDDLPTTFACAALVGTAGNNNEFMMDAGLSALSPMLNAAGACNAGFIRDDALLVMVFISDEDDPGSSGVGTPGDPNTWHNDVLAVKMFEENVVVLTLTRGAPGNVCGGAQGSEVDGARLMQFATLFGANGFLGDICANSFGPFFDDAIGVIESACESFMPPEG